MPSSHQFEHLALVQIEHGPARLSGGNSDSELTKSYKLRREEHSLSLRTSITSASQQWKSNQAARVQEGAPNLEVGIPLLLKVDPSLDLNKLRSQFEFEIVSEEEEGFVIVASEDVDLKIFQQKLTDFASKVSGSSNVARIHQLLNEATQEERVRHILSDVLNDEWSKMGDEEIYICDVGVSCVGNWDRPQPYKARSNWGDEANLRHSEIRAAEIRAAYDQWDELRDNRLKEINQITSHYDSEVIGQFEDDVSIPDSFTLRIRISALGLKDLVINYPYVFEVTEPDDIETPQQISREDREITTQLEFQEPPSDSPTVCVIDSGIQEQHRWLAKAIDSGTSRCFLLDLNDCQVNDEVPPSGHGTRVAGAVLYGNQIPKSGVVKLETRIQNARVLDARCNMPAEMFPPEILAKVVRHFHEDGQGTRLFNHSINADAPCRIRHMSAWAAEIDRLSSELDILIIQSTGNIKADRPAPCTGVAQLLDSGKSYPSYLSQPACRIANPAQSLQALTVGSVADSALDQNSLQSFAKQKGEPSAFSRSGFGIWNAIKPEVVEFGGDFLRDKSQPSNISTPLNGKACYPELIRSTMTGGPAFDQDEVGTSFSAPQVARLAARLQSVLPEESSLLYRALVVQSARWPEWAKGITPEKQVELIRQIGYGIPDINRASENTDHRVTLITNDTQSIGAKECHVYQIPIPHEIRRPADEHEIRIDVTLSYAAAPRRTRRGHAYLATWCDWVSNRRRESLEGFVQRAIKLDKDYPKEGENSAIPWTVHPMAQHGLSGVDRNAGTVQKDWAYISSYDLPEDLCIAVRGHEGWRSDLDSRASYTLAVTFEIAGQQIPIYDALRHEIQVLAGEIEVEVEVEGR